MGMRTPSSMLEGTAQGGQIERPFKQPVYVPDWLRGTSIFATLTTFILKDFARSPWIWLNIVGVGIAHLLSFGSAPDRGAFFSVTYLSTLVLAALDTAGIFSRANHPHTYPILARRVSKSTYVAAGLLSAWIVGILTFGLAALAVFIRYSVLAPVNNVQWLDLSTLLRGILPVAVGLACMVGLMALVANFVSPFGVRLLVLAVITLGVMAFDPRTFPIENLRPFVEVIPPLLAPLVGALHFATDTQPDTVARASLLVVSAYATTIIGVVWWLSSRREIVIE